MTSNFRLAAFSTPSSRMFIPSVSLAMCFRAADRTMTHEEIDTFQSAFLVQAVQCG